MSNFETFGLVSNGEQGTAPSRYTASTSDNLATITAAGYLNDLAHIIKPNDVIDINYSDLSTFPLNTGMNATYKSFQVIYASPNWSLGNPPNSGGYLVAANNFSEIATQGAVSQAASLENLGIHSAKASVTAAGASVTITDAKVTAASVVVGNWQSQATAGSVLTVTPGAGSFVVTSSATVGVAVFAYVCTTAVE
jgi:hypothetical protein